MAASTATRSRGVAIRGDIVATTRRPRREASPSNFLKIIAMGRIPWQSFCVGGTVARARRGHNPRPLRSRGPQAFGVPLGRARVCHEPPGMRRERDTDARISGPTDLGDWPSSVAHVLASPPMTM